MASDLSFVQHVCDSLGAIRGLTYRKMFGEYAVYVEGKVVALVCDNQLFVKPTIAGRELLGAPPEGAPYPGAKPHFMCDEYIDDSDLLTALLLATAAGLPEPKSKSKSKKARVRRRD